MFTIIFPTHSHNTNIVVWTLTCNMSTSTNFLHKFTIHYNCVKNEYMKYNNYNVGN